MMGKCQTYFNFEVTRSNLLKTKSYLLKTVATEDLWKSITNTFIAKEIMLKTYFNFCIVSFMQSNLV